MVPWSLNKSKIHIGAIYVSIWKLHVYGGQLNKTTLLKIFKGADFQKQYEYIVKNPSRL